MRTKNAYLTNMGAKVKAARMAKGLYLKHLSQMCNLHVSAINEIELGKRNPHLLTLKAMADALEVDVKDFL